MKLTQQLQHTVNGKTVQNTGKLKTPHYLVVIEEAAFLLV